jgi:hypothetical protein
MITITRKEKMFFTKFWKIFLIAALTGIAFAASSLEESSRELAKEIAPSLAGKTVAVLDFLDQKKQVRELGRVISDQYLRVDLSRMGVKMVTRSALDKALAEIKLSQAGLTEAVSSGGLGSKFKAADVIVTGSLSQIGDTYTASTEAIDVKTGASLGLSRATFPKTSSYQALWDSVIEVPMVQGNTSPVVTPSSTIPAPAAIADSDSKVLENGGQAQSQNFKIKSFISFNDAVVEFYIYILNSSSISQGIEIKESNIKIYDNNNKVQKFEVFQDGEPGVEYRFEKDKSKYVIASGYAMGMWFRVERDLFDNTQNKFFLNLSEQKSLNINQTWAREIGK